MVARLVRDPFDREGWFFELKWEGFRAIADGYLGHEFLSTHTREGRYGGGFENRTRFSGTWCLSAFDAVPFARIQRDLPWGNWDLESPNSRILRKGFCPPTPPKQGQAKTNAKQCDSLDRVSATELSCRTTCFAAQTAGHRWLISPVVTGKVRRAFLYAEKD